MFCAANLRTATFYKWNENKESYPAFDAVDEAINSGKKSSLNWDNGIFNIQVNQQVVS